MFAILNNINRKKTALALITHPVFIALGTTLMILLVFPPDFPEYKLTLLDGTTNNDKISLDFWDDLDNNGTSDQILTYDNPIGTAAVGVYFYPKRNVQQWDLYGKFGLLGTNYVSTGDYDNNGKKEIYVFTLSSDTIFLHIISDFSALIPDVTNRFIARTGQLHGKSDAHIIDPQMDDQDGDGYKELIFGITTGFSIYPRALFKYDIHHDSLTRSCETGNYLNRMILADINGDSINEIITGGYAPQNILDTLVQYHDSSNWGMVFDRNLKLLFPPHEFPGRTGATIPLALPTDNGYSRLYFIWWLPSTIRGGSFLYQVSSTGKARMIRDLHKNYYPGSKGDPALTEYQKRINLVMYFRNGDILFYDSSFEEIRKISTGHQIYEHYQMDIDLDGKKEIILIDDFSNILTVLRDDFSAPATLAVDLKIQNRTRVSVKKGFGPNPLFFIHAGDLKCTLSYTKNPWYHARFGVWFAVSLAVYLFTLGVRKIQRVQLEKKYATEKKITELQLKIVKNQMDPHFTLNAINSVKEAIGRQEKEEAGLLLNSFAGMYRSLLLSADTIQRTLAAEIDFCRNYLALEKFRMQNRFEYSINIDPSVNTTWEVPKMILQSHVENAVKHGLYNKPEGGFLKINIFTEDHSLVLEIEDNGQGRALAGARKTDSTGKGLKIMDQLLDLYFKITGVKVTTEISDLYDENQQVTGTKVRTVIKIDL